MQVDAGREWRGGQDQVRLLTRALLGAEDLEVRLVTQRGGELARRAAEHGVAVVPVPWTVSLDPRALWRLVRALAAFRPHILHAHDSHALQLAAWARRLRGGEGRPALIATRRVDFHVRPGSVWFQADHVIAISRAIERILVADGLSRDVISVIPSGIDAAEVQRAAARPLDVRARLGLAPNSPLAVNVAALVDHKDHGTLVRAAHAARTARPSLHWVIAGDGPRRRGLEADIAALGLADRVHLLGYVPEADALIREADVFVMSSKEEGLGSVVLHALALGTPVVATRGGGLPEIVPEEWTVPVGDAAALADRVIGALDHPSRTPLPPQCTAAAMARGVLARYRALA